MKKLLLVIPILLVISLAISHIPEKSIVNFPRDVKRAIFSAVGYREHVYTTVYGKVDIDTIKNILTDTNGISCYRIHTIGTDTIYKNHIFQKGDVIYYQPFDNTYFIFWLTSTGHGNAGVKWEPNAE